MKNLLYKLNLQKYLPFLKVSEDNDLALGIYDTVGEQYKLTCFDHSKNLQEFLQHYPVPDLKSPRKEWNQISKRWF